MSQCCVTGFRWDGNPSGKEIQLGNNNAYLAGSNDDVAILVSSSRLARTNTLL